MKIAVSMFSGRTLILIPCCFLLDHHQLWVKDTACQRTWKSEVHTPPQLFILKSLLWSFLIFNVNSLLTFMDMKDPLSRFKRKIIIEIEFQTYEHGTFHLIMRSISRHWNSLLQCKLFPLPCHLKKRKLNTCYSPQNQNTLSTRNSGTHKTPQQIQLHIRSKTLLSNCFLCLCITGINEFLSRINIFTFRPPLSSGNIGIFKDCLLLEQGRDDLLFSLFLSLSTCMHADASNLTSSVSTRKQKDNVWPLLLSQITTNALTLSL